MEKKKKKNKNKNNKLECKYCQKTINKNNLTSHIRKQHGFSEICRCHTGWPDKASKNEHELDGKCKITALIVCKHCGKTTPKRSNRHDCTIDE